MDKGHKKVNNKNIEPSYFIIEVEVKGLELYFLKRYLISFELNSNLYLDFILMVEISTNLPRFHSVNYPIEF